MSRFLNKNTPNGFNVYDLMSALQKFIRRGMEEEALYAFYELEAGGHYTLAANRLKVIIYEDCGIANLSLMNSANGHFDNMAAWYKSKNGAWRLILGNLILQACRGKRTRIADYFVSQMAFRRVNGYVLDMEEHEKFVYDKHTRKGKAKGRGIKHFFDEAVTILHPETFKTEQDYRQAELDNIESAYEKGPAWDLYRMDNRNTDYELFPEDTEGKVEDE